MKNDVDLRNDVLKELEWDPSIHAARVGVAVSHGVVTLTGHLDSFAEKFAIEKAVGKVRGVKAIAIEMDVKLEPGHKRSDSEIAAAVESALQWHSQVPEENIQVKVEKGWVTLKGEVEWNYQRQKAGNAVRSLTGVVGVSNNISLKPATIPANISAMIREALTRHALREAKDIGIELRGKELILRGEVDSWAERSAVYAAAWAAPGISSVRNEISVKT